MQRTANEVKQCELLTGNYSSINLTYTALIGNRTFSMSERKELSTVGRGSETLHRATFKQSTLTT